MTANPDERRPHVFGRAATAVPVVVLLGLCLAPYAGRLREPSLYADDVERVAQLQTRTFGRLLVLPFNEHLAPLFQLESWLTWRLAGRSLTAAPGAFTVASVVPFGLTLGLLAWVLRRETRSAAAALAGVAVFSLSWLTLETVIWYSASSFMGALLLTLAAWAAAEPGAGRRPGWRRAAALLAAAGAPAFSMIGLLAGPVAAVRAAAAAGRRGWRDALPPVAGTLLFLAAYAVGHDRAGVASDVDPGAGIGPGLVAATRAPAAALVPAVLGVRTLPATGAAGVALSVLTLAAAAVLVVVAVRRPAGRPAILGGLVLIAGGYALTYCARAGAVEGRLLETQRYHLFPLLGLVFLLAPGLRWAFAPWRDRPAVGLWGAAALAAALLVTHRAEMRGRIGFLRFPDQPERLAALDRLGATCARLGVTRDQALFALDPVEAAWCPRGYSVFRLLGPCAPSARVPDPLVRSTLLAALRPADRRTLSGGMDATAYLRPGADPHREALAVGRPVQRFRVREAGGRPVAEGWPAFVEYELDGPATADARRLTLSGPGPAGAGGGGVEVWWTGAGGRWSALRSVRLRPRGAGAWELPLESLPHWDPSQARRVRLLYHDAGPVALESPRLVR